MSLFLKVTHRRFNHIDRIFARPKILRDSKADDHLSSL